MHEFLCPKFDYLDYFHVFISQHLRNYKTNTYCNLISSAVQLNPRILSFAHSHPHAGNTDSRVKVASHRKRLAAQQTNKTRRGVCCIVSNALRWVGGRCCGATCFDALRLPVPRSISMACGREASFWIFGARGPRPKSNGKLKPATQNRVHNFLKIPWHGTLSCEPWSFLHDLVVFLLKSRKLPMSCDWLSFSLCVCLPLILRNVGTWHDRISENS